MLVDEDRKKSLKFAKFAALLLVNVVSVAALCVYFRLQESSKADLRIDDFNWSGHLADVNFSTPYVSVYGTIRNLGPGTAVHVNLIVDIYVDYQCGHHMNALVEKEILSIGAIGENCSKEFRYDIPYNVNSTLPCFLKVVEYSLAWTS